MRCIELIVPFCHLIFVLSLFYGKKRQRLTPLTAGLSEGRQRTVSTHEKEDVFSHLHINVSDEGFDLYDGLGRYFDDVVDLNGVKKRMEVTVVDLPPLLQIQLQVCPPDLIMR